MITSGYDRVAAARDGRESVNNLRKNLVNTPSISIGVHQKSDRGASKTQSGCIESSIGVHQKSDRGASKIKRERKKGAITQDMFRAMDWHERMELVNKYKNVKDKDFDDGTFAFSVTTFKNLCQELHIEDVLIDTSHQKIADKEDTSSIEHDDVIIISRERRDVVTKKLHISKDTSNVMASLFDDVKIKNEEKSKIIDYIIKEAFEHYVASKKEGNLSVEYAEKIEQKIIDKNKIL